MLSKEDARKRLENMGYSCTLKNGVVEVKITGVTDKKVNKLKQDLRSIGYNASYAIIGVPEYEQLSMDNILTEGR